MRKNDIRRKRFKVPVIRTGDDPVLTTVCDDVGPDEDALKICQQIISAMMQHDRCVGLAANQVGITKRVICIQIPGSFPKSFINPKVAELSDNLITLEEGCLSYPSIKAEVRRNEMITIEYENEARIVKREKLGSLESRIILHGLDHLDGKCILVRATDIFAEKPAIEDNQGPKIESM